MAKAPSCQGSCGEDLKPILFDGGVSKSLCFQLVSCVIGVVHFSLAVLVSVCFSVVLFAGGFMFHFWFAPLVSAKDMSRPELCLHIFTDETTVAILLMC